MKTKVLGTGLSGLIGSRIVELLKEKFDFENLGFEQGFDITKPETIENKIASSETPIFIHLAAFTDVGAAWKDKDNKDGPCYQINVVGTQNTAALCQKYQKHLIHFSTDYVFDGEKDTPYTEDDKPNSKDWYGRTKLWAEEAVKDSGGKWSIIRTAFPFRASYALKKDFLCKIIDGLKSQTLYPQFCDQTVTPTFIDDIVCGMEKIIEGRPKGIFHLTGSSFISPYELALKAAKAFGFDEGLVKKGSLAEYLKKSPDARPYPRSLKMSNEKAKMALGIEMKTIDEALLTMKKQMLLQ